MKIVLVNDMAYRYASGDPAAVGGAERYQWLLARALSAHGWSATIGVQRAVPYGERVRIDGVDFLGIGTGSYLPALYRFFTAEQPDWCFWFGSTHWLGPAAAVARSAAVQTVFSAQFDLDVRPREALSEWRRFWPLYSLGLSGSRKIFLQHGDQYAGLPARWRQKAHVIPGVVAVPDRMRPHAERKPYVAWVGVLRQPKRPDLLIEIARACPAVEFVVCGGVSNHRSPPGYGEQIVHEFHRVPNISYLGQVSPERAVDIISDAALLLSTSDAEGFPSVFVEAWAHGTPVVSMKIDPDQVIATHGLGALADSVDAAARTIAALTASSDARESSGSRARAYAVRTHSGPAVARLVDRVLRAPSATMLPRHERTAES